MRSDDLISTLDAYLLDHVGDSVTAVANAVAVELGIGEPPLPYDELRKLAGAIRDRRAVLGLPQVDVGHVRPQDSWPWGAANFPDHRKEA